MSVQSVVSQDTRDSFRNRNKHARKVVFLPLTGAEAKKVVQTSYAAGKLRPFMVSRLEWFYENARSVFCVNREGGMPHGGCCLMLPPETWLRFGLLVMNGGSWQRVYVIPSADLVIVRTGMPSADWDDGVIPNIILRDLGYGQGQS